MPTKRRRYDGELGKKIVRPASPTFSGAVTKERVERFNRERETHEYESDQLIAQKLSRKMGLLLKHFGIADEDYAALAWALAFEHVPGFRVVLENYGRKGRKKEWDGFKLEALYVACADVKAKANLTDRQALKFISNNPEFAREWGPPKGYKGSDKQWIGTLESRLQDANRYMTFIRSLPAMLEAAKAEVSGEEFRKSEN